MYLDTNPQGKPERDRESRDLDEASKLLLKAADVIEREGWCQNNYASLDGRLCILGALRVALGLDSNFSGFNSRLGDACSRFTSAVDKSPHKWNDVPGRTAEEVVAKLRAVALSG